jgi:hypothetical protein
MKIQAAKPLRFLLALTCLMLAFTSATRAQSRIYYTDDYHDSSMAANGTDKRVDVRGEPSYYLHGGQRWFLQYRSVAGTYPDGRGRGEIFAVSQDGASASQLSDDPDLKPSFFRWLENDAAISYSGVHYHGGGPLDGDSHIVRIAVADDGGVLAVGGPATVVATAGVTVVSGHYLQSDIFSFDWAPDGAEFVYEDRPGYNAGYSVFILRRVIIATGAVSLVIDNATSPVYAPNGIEIAIRRGGYRITSGIFAIHPDGSGMRSIVKDSQSIFNSGPAWSPDGVSLAFRRQSTTKKGSKYSYAWDICTVPSSGGSGAKITNLTGDINYDALLTAWR